MNTICHTLHKLLIQNSLFVLFTLLAGNVVAQTITVKQDGTGQFTLIQDAINAAWDGDTVLVWPGRYYENLHYNGKNIVVGSLNMTTGDPMYKNNTIIDGNQKGSCLLVNSGETNACIFGFTLENGSGTYIGSFTTYGGGICVWEECNLLIVNCVIQNNIVNSSGGGICSKQSNIYISGSTVRNNQAFNSGGGISSSYYNTIHFDTVNLCSIYNNYAIAGADIYKGAYCEPLHIKLDTFTVAQPDHYFLFSMDGYIYYSGNDISCQMQHPKIEQVCCDLYVSPEGNDNNSGLSVNDPLQHLWFAMLKTLPDSNEMHKIYLAPGTWAPSMGERFPICMRSFTEIEGVHRDTCILDAEQISYHLKSKIQDNGFSIENLTLRNGHSINDYDIRMGSFNFLGSIDVSMKNILISKNFTFSSVGSVWGCDNVIVNDVVFKDNTGGSAFSAGAHSLGWVVPYDEPDTVTLNNCKFNLNKPDTSNQQSLNGSIDIVGEYAVDYENILTCLLMNCELTNNTTKLSSNGEQSSGIVIANEGIMFMINCTLGDNTNENTDGSHISVITDSKLYIYNSILYNNQQNEIYLWGDPNYWY